jgi:hypothetical protein
MSMNHRGARRALHVAGLAAALFSAAPAASAACDHPYFPLKQGKTFVYEKSGIRVTQVVTRIDGNAFTFEAKTGPKGAEMTVTTTGGCSADGLTLNLGASISSSKGTQIRILKHTGSDFGPPAQMKVGGTWTSALIREMTTGKVTMTISTKSTHKVVASEKVKVPAGEYDALKIETETETATKKAGSPKSEATRSKTTAWLVKGIGLVKSQSAATEPGGEPFPPMELVSASN